MIKYYDQLVKLILIGGSGVGKSSILIQFAENKFTDNYLTTIGVDFRFKTIKHDGKTIKFQIWDTAGQYRFRTITSAYYKGADGIIMVYDLTDPGSLEDIEQFWIPEAHNYCDKNIKVLLLGNKSDAERVVSEEKVTKIVDKYGFRSEVVSAKTNDKILESIRDFGVAVAREKFGGGTAQTGGSNATGASGGKDSTSQSSKSVNNTQTNVSSGNTGSQQNSYKSATKNSASTTMEKNTSKSVYNDNKVVYNESMKLTQLKQRAVPNYQKKCC